MMATMGPAGRDPSLVAFVLCELDWARRMLVARLSCEPLAAFAEAARDGVAELEASEVRAIRASIEDLEELVTSISHSASVLAPEPISVSAEQVSSAAAAALADGIADTARAMHAAGWIAAERGLEALGTALTQSDAYRLWDVAVVRFLMAFRGLGDERARELVMRADLGHDAVFADLTGEQVARLARVLVQSAEGGA